MAIPTGVGDRQHQSFMESGTGKTARRVHVSGGTVDALTAVVGTVNIVAILGTITNLQSGTITTVGALQTGTIDMVKAGTLDMVKAATVSMVTAGTIDTVKMVQDGTLSMLKAGTIDKIASGTIDTVSMLSAGTVTTVGMVQAGTLDMVKAATVSMLTAGTITTVAMVQAGTLDMLKAGTVTLSTLIAGEQQTQDIMKVEQQVLYSVCTVDAAVKSAAGRYWGFYVNSTNAGTISIYDAASATGVAIQGTIVPAAGLHVFPFSVTMATGIYFDLVGGTISALLFYQ